MGNGSAPLMFSESDNAVASCAFRSGWRRCIPSQGASPADVHGPTHVDCGSARLKADTFRRLLHCRSAGDEAKFREPSRARYPATSRWTNRWTNRWMAVDIAVDNFVD